MAKNEGSGVLKGQRCIPSRGDIRAKSGKAHGATVIIWGKERCPHQGTVRVKVMEATENPMDIPGMQDLSQRLTRWSWKEAGARLQKVF